MSSINQNQINSIDNELIFSLNLLDRNFIVSTLKHYCNFLPNSINNKQLIDNLNNNKQNIIKLLNNLPIKNNLSINSNHQLDLKLSTKNDLIINLMNHSEYSKHTNLIDEQSKIDLIQETKQLIFQLINLNSNQDNIATNQSINDKDGDIIFLGEIDSKLNEQNNLIKSIDEHKNDNRIEKQSEKNEINRLHKKLSDIKGQDEDIVNFLKKTFKLEKDSFVTTDQAFIKFNQHFFIDSCTEIGIKRDLGKLIQQIFNNDQLKITVKSKKQVYGYSNLKMIKNVDNKINKAKHLKQITAKKKIKQINLKNSFKETSFNNQIDNGNNLFFDQSNGSLKKINSKIDGIAITEYISPNRPIEEVIRERYSKTTDNLNKTIDLKKKLKSDQQVKINKINSLKKSTSTSSIDSKRKQNNLNYSSAVNLIIPTTESSSDSSSSDSLSIDSSLNDSSPNDSSSNKIIETAKNPSYNQSSSNHLNKSINDEELNYEQNHQINNLNEQDSIKSVDSKKRNLLNGPLLPGYRIPKKAKATDTTKEIDQTIDNLSRVLDDKRSNKINENIDLFDDDDNYDLQKLVKLIGYNETSIETISNYDVFAKLIDILKEYFLKLDKLNKDQITDNQIEIIAHCLKYFKNFNNDDTILILKFIYRYCQQFKIHYKKVDYYIRYRIKINHNENNNQIEIFCQSIDKLLKIYVSN